MGSLNTHTHTSTVFWCDRLAVHEGSRKTNVCVRVCVCTRACVCDGVGAAVRKKENENIILCFHSTQWKACQKVQPHLIICLFCLGNNMLSSCHRKNQGSANVVCRWSFARCFKNWCHPPPPYSITFWRQHQQSFLPQLPSTHPSHLREEKTAKTRACWTVENVSVCQSDFVYYRPREDWTHEENYC